MEDVTSYTSDKNVWIGNRKDAERIATVLNGGTGGVKQTNQGYIVYSYGTYVTKDTVNSMYH